jgi:hypothetical protein
MSTITEDGAVYDEDLIGGGSVHSEYDPATNVITTVLTLTEGDTDFAALLGVLLETFDADSAGAF